MDDKNDIEWYSNKEIFEQLLMFKNEFIAHTEDLTKEMYGVKQQMTETQALIKEYNGLRKDIENMHKDSDICKGKLSSDIVKPINNHLEKMENHLERTDGDLLELKKN